MSGVIGVGLLEAGKGESGSKEQEIIIDDVKISRKALIYGFIFFS